MTFSLVRRIVIKERAKFPRRLYTSEGSNLPTWKETPDCPVISTEDFPNLRREELAGQRTLRIAILGLPNAGKSTLVNQLVFRPVCAASSKVHTTRIMADAIYCQENTQLVFIDTPGLVTKNKSNEFNLEKSFSTHPGESIKRADIIGIMQDAYNTFSGCKINSQIMEILERSKAIPSILILNKVDIIKKKEILLKLVKSLTSKEGWPHFKDIFMVSALTGDGVEDLRTYFLDCAKPRNWDYERHIFSNQSFEDLIVQTVKAKLLDSLPNELPYILKPEMEHFTIRPDGSISSIVLIDCPSDRIAKLVLGRRAIRVKTIAQECEQNLLNAFQTPVKIKLDVKFKGFLQVFPVWTPSC
ncbi:GTPase Era, mitochondrial isoform X2 [Orussus abietinus]|uniref:GTPase Era, mitochondrial isoform X2 n=1 Tax=Orussus abietinus TaxID=222816 RepID=UPI00062516FD|nr:GTPase Era, mitochondrial isoform X2 [Orussus abietinus]